MKTVEVVLFHYLRHEVFSPMHLEIHGYVKILFFKLKYFVILFHSDKCVALLNTQEYLKT